jgi:hypothetical protein
MCNKRRSYSHCDLISSHLNFKENLFEQILRLFAHKNWFHPLKLSYSLECVEQICLENISDGYWMCPIFRADAIPQQKKVITEFWQYDAKLQTLLHERWPNLLRISSWFAPVLRTIGISYVHGSNAVAHWIVLPDNGTHHAKLQNVFVDLLDELPKYNENILSERMWTGEILSTLGKEYDNFKEWIQFLRANKRWICSVRSSVKLSCELINSKQLKLQRSLHMKRKSKSRILRKRIPVNVRKEELIAQSRNFRATCANNFRHWPTECPKKNQHARDRVDQWDAKTKTRSHCM